MAHWADEWKWAKKEVATIRIFDASFMLEKTKEAQEAIALKEALKPRIQNIISLIEKDILAAAEKGKTQIDFISWYEDTELWGMNQKEMLMLEPVIKKIFTNNGYICCDGEEQFYKGKHYYSWGKIIWG